MGMSILDPKKVELAELEADYTILLNRCKKYEELANKLKDENTSLKSQLQSKSIWSDSIKDIAGKFMDKLAEKYPDDFPTEPRHSNCYKMSKTTFIQLLLDIIAEKDLIMDIFEAPSKRS